MAIIYISLALSMGNQILHISVVGSETDYVTHSEYSDTHSLHVEASPKDYYTYRLVTSKLRPHTCRN